MSESNGQFHDPTPYELIVSWLSYLSDAERCRLRHLLVETRMVRREHITPKGEGDGS